MNINHLVTVIVPIYNAEKHIQRCLDSIVMQVYQNIEVILIDDGSQDSSLAICHKYADLDERITVFHQANKGVSAARNLGLENMHGKYVVFVDADDWLTPYSIYTMVKEGDLTKAQLIVFEYEKNKEFITKKQLHGEGKTVCLDRDSIYKKIINPYGFYGSVWAKIFCAEVIKENNIRFDTDIEIGEDLWFVFQYISYIESYYYNEEKVYHYYENEESALRKNRGSEFDKRLDILKVYEKMLLVPNITDESYYKRIVSIYVRELCEWYSVSCYYKKYDYALDLKKIIKKYIRIYLYDSTFPLKTKITAIFKCSLPKLMHFLKLKFN